jgi:hypothetical protein
MPCRQATIPVLNLVKVLDEEVPPSRRIAKQSQNVLQRFGIDASAFRR